MASFNKVILIGNLTADPELKQTQNGISVTSFSIAVSRRFSSKNTENAQQADFINIVAWRNTAEFVSKYFTKGMQVAVEGSIQVRSYTDRDGNKRRAWEIIADQVYFADSKRDGGYNAGGRTESAPPAVSNASADDFTEFDGGDDLPF